MTTRDLVVVGLGAVGAAALADAAGRGVDVLGVEPHGIGHEKGASGGRSRIFRMAYKEGSEYLPLLRESRARWDALQAATEEPFWLRTGVITIGGRDHPGVVRLMECVAEGALPHSVLAAAEAAQRWPRHRFAPDDVVVADPQGGLLLPAAAIRAQVRAAQRLGAEVVTGRVAAVDRAVGGFRLRLDDGSAVAARRVVVACGAWAGDLVPAVAPLTELRRVVLHWYPTAVADDFGPERFPVGIRHRRGQPDFSFFPQLDPGGIKVNWYLPKTPVGHAASPVNPVPAAYSRRVSPFVREVFDGVDPHASGAVAYVESYTPDLRPYVGPAGGGDGFCVVTGLSGQGFKMSPALGRMAVDMALGVTS